MMPKGELIKIMKQVGQEMLRLRQIRSVWMIRHLNARDASREIWLLHDTRNSATATWMT